ncbi:MAG: alcohol dehydrogenase catalytic domain-containing protein [Dehalococcoidia bacterium]
MLAAYCTSKETIEVKDGPSAEPGAGEVTVRVRSCGICGSDLHFYHGALPAMASVPPGHEFAGEISALGEGVSGWAVGDRVVVEPIRSCRDCEYCTSGRYHLCPRRVLLGTFHPGGLAEAVTVPAYTLYRLPDSLDFELGALVEPLAVAVHGLHIVNVAAGEKVLVLGSGTIGLMSVAAVRYAGADVVATYRHDHQGEAAQRLGASRVVRGSEMTGLEMEGFDAVIETIGGTAPTLTQALGIVRAGGRVSVLGLFTQPTSLHALNLMLKEISVVGGITYCRPGLHSDFDTALRILEQHGETLRTLVTHRFSLSQAAEAFATAADKSSNSVKVHVNP